jgi:hypothetical protein
MLYICIYEVFIYSLPLDFSCSCKLFPQLKLLRVQFIYRCGLYMSVYNISFLLLIHVLQPVAAGSGIPEIKCYLNGIKVSKYIHASYSVKCNIPFFTLYFFNKCTGSLIVYNNKIILTHAILSSIARGAHPILRSLLRPCHSC